MPLWQHKESMAKKTALISVFDKTSIVEFAKVLIKKNFEIISTGGTAKILKDHKIPIINIEKITGNPEAFDGRMKTISFALESGILFDRSKKSHVQQARELKIKAIDLVVCNFYDFAKNPGIEMIDIGGPTMVRAAAKNFQHVTVITDPQDYFKIKFPVSLKTRKELALKAFQKTALYDSQVYQYFSQNSQILHLHNGTKLRYGENPHQSGFWYKLKSQDPLALQNFSQLQGKELSFNNLLDCEAAINTLAYIDSAKPACVVIKHTNPCGAAFATTIIESFQKAWDGDSLAAFGSIIAVNRPIDEKLAQIMLSEKRFFEVLLAPSITPKAQKIFSKKPNLRLLTNQALKTAKHVQELDYKKIRGGFLSQNQDTVNLDFKSLKTVTRKKPTSDQLEDLIFAWAICRASKSNTIVLAKNNMLIGSGVGQQDRKRCCELAVAKAGKRATGCVAASDAFFPFSDGPDILIKTGVEAIIQPGGSIRDADTINLCNKTKTAMVLTAVRCFRH